MNQHVRRLSHSCAAAVTLLIGILSTAGAQDAGIISGRVIDAASNAPVASAQVQVVGTTRGGVTGDDVERLLVGSEHDRVRAELPRFVLVCCPG